MDEEDDSSQAPEGRLDDPSGDESSDSESGGADEGSGDDESNESNERDQAGAPARAAPAMAARHPGPVLPQRGQGRAPEGQGAAGRDEIPPEEWEAVKNVFFFIRVLMEVFLRRTLPFSVHSKLSSEDCIRQFPVYAQAGFLDGTLAHYTNLAQELLAAGPSVRPVVTLTPVQPGELLTGALLALARQQLNSGAPTSAMGAAASAVLKPRLPEPEPYEGPQPGTSQVVALRRLCQWIDTCRTNAALSGMPEPQQVAWAATFLKGPAASWWATSRLTMEIHSFDQFKDGLVQRFVGNNAFELVCADLEGKSLKTFPRFDIFKAWFVQTVAAMKAFAPPRRMWTDTVLIDKLLLCIKGTLYYEGVVVDPVTRMRPDTFAQAIDLLDKHHDVLLMRGQAHEDKGKAAAGGSTSYADAAKAGQGKDSGKGKRPMGADAGKSKPDPKRTKADSSKEGFLPLDQFIMKTHGLRNAKEVQQHIEDSKAKPAKPLECVLCGKDHFVTKCKRHFDKLKELKKGKGKIN